MCRNSLMIDTDVIQCLLDDLLDQVSLMNSSPVIVYSPSIFSAKSIEDQFNRSIDILNHSIKQILFHELNTVVRNGPITNTGTTRHSRYYSPAMTMKHSNDLRKRLQWIQKRQNIIKCLNNGENEQIFHSTT